MAVLVRDRALMRGPEERILRRPLLEDGFLVRWLWPVVLVGVLVLMLVSVAVVMSLGLGVVVVLVRGHGSS